MVAAGGQRGTAGLAALVTLPAGLAAAAAVGAAAQAAYVLNPYGVANPVVTLAAMFAVGAACVYAVRLGHLRRQGWATLFAFLVVAAFVGGAIAGGGLAAGRGTFLADWWAKRLQNGAPLFGAGRVAIGGGWLWAAAVIEAIIILFTALATSTTEAEGMYCEDCRSWARRERWRYATRRFDPSAAKDLSSSSSLKDCLNVPNVAAPDGSTLVYSVRSCACGRRARLNVTEETKGKDSTSRTERVESVELTPLTLGKLCDWARAREPAAVPAKPDLPMLRGESDRTPFTGPPPAEAGKEPVSTYRSGGAIQKDLSADNAYTLALRKRLQSGDYLAAEEALRQQTNVEDFTLVAEACADWCTAPSWFADWAEHRPDSILLRLVRGIHGVKWAWEARGAGWKPKNHPEFQRRLDRAEADLIEVSQRSSRDATALAWLIRSATGKEFYEGRNLNKEAIEQRLQEAHRRSPWHRAAYSFAIDGLSTKWGGSDEHALALARRVLAEAPPGHPVHVVMPIAHGELAATLHRSTGRRASDEYWKRQDVVRDLVAANAKRFAAGAVKPTMTIGHAHETFAYALWKAGCTDLAAEHFRALGPGSPWGAFAPPALLFSRDRIERARRECGVR